MMNIDLHDNLSRFSVHGIHLLNDFKRKRSFMNIKNERASYKNLKNGMM